MSVDPDPELRGKNNSKNWSQIRGKIILGLKHWRFNWKTFLLYVFLNLFSDTKKQMANLSKYVLYKKKAITFECTHIRHLTLTVKKKDKLGKIFTYALDGE